MISTKTITIVSAITGGIGALALFVLLTIWLYRRQFALTLVDEEALPAYDLKHQPPYFLDHKDFRLLDPPKVARIAPPSFRTADALPDPTQPMYGAAASENGGDKYTSPPPLSSVWRGRQWVTVSRPKTPRTAPPVKTPKPNPISEKIVLGRPEKKSRVQRLSAMITKLRSDFMEVQL